MDAEKHVVQSSDLMTHTGIIKTLLNLLLLCRFKTFKQLELHIRISRYTIAGMINATDFYKTLSDSTRLRCLFLLSQCKSLCVCDFMEILEAPQSRISRHFKYLRDAGLVTDERKDQWVYYRLNPDLAPLWRDMLKQNMKHLREQQPFQNDLARLKVYQKMGCC